MYTATKSPVHISYHIVSAGYARIGDSYRSLGIAQNRELTVQFDNLTYWFARKRHAEDGQYFTFNNRVVVTLDDINNARAAFAVAHGIELNDVGYH